MTDPTERVPLQAVTLVALAFFFAGTQMARTDTPVVPGNDVTLILELSPKDARLLAYEPLAPTSDEDNRRWPRLLEETGHWDRPGIGRTVFVFIDQGGETVGDFFAVRGSQLAFRDSFQRQGPSAVRLIPGSGFFEPLRDQRIVQLPIPDGSVALLIVRDVKFLHLREPVRDIAALGLFVFSSFDPGAGFPPAGGLPTHVPGERVPIAREFINLLEDAPELAHRTDHVLPIQLPKIVVIGDGFTANDQQKFQDRAQVIKNALVGVPAANPDPGISPYSTVLNNSDVRILWFPTSYGTIDNCPCDNYLTVHSLTLGNFQGADHPGSYGTEYLARFWLKVVWELGWASSAIDAIVVIPNCDVFGGAAYPEGRIAFVSDEANLYQQYLGHTAAHELGHVLAGLGDEYISCTPEGLQPDGSMIWTSELPNIASHQDHLNGNVPWQATGPTPILQCCPPSKCPASLGCPVCPSSLLGLPGHGYRQTDGRLVNSQGDVVGELGLFWGAAFVDAAGPVCDCDIEGHPLSCGYYRPMEKCKMRDPWMLDDFCEICKQQLTSVLQ